MSQENVELTRAFFEALRSRAASCGRSSSIILRRRTATRAGRRTRGETMPLYLSRFSYTPETWARLIGGGTNDPGRPAKAEHLALLPPEWKSSRARCDRGRSAPEKEARRSGPLASWFVYWPLVRGDTPPPRACRSPCGRDWGHSRDW